MDAFYGDEVVRLVDSLTEANASMTRAQRALFRAIHRCARLEVWRHEGCRNMAHWLSVRIGISNWTAARWVAAASALETLPGISDAFERGALCLDKVVELARFATPDTEKELIRWARRVTLATVRQRADLANRPELDEVNDAQRFRYLRHGYSADRTRWWLEGTWPADLGAVVAKALDRLADALPQDPEEQGDDDLDPETDACDVVERRRADALYALASGALALDRDPDRATVVVHAPLEALAGADVGCELEAGPVLHPETARRLACDARLEVVLHGVDGDAVGIGHAARTPPASLLRELRRRDRGCAFPGCDLKRFVHAHHIEPWPKGATTLTNLVLLCPFHHRLVHEGGWRVELGEQPGTARWYRRDGRRFDPGPTREAKVGRSAARVSDVAASHCSVATSSSPSRPDGSLTALLPNAFP